MKTVLSTIINNQTLYLNHDDMATDRIENAKAFRCLSDASVSAVFANKDEAWSKWHIQWMPEQILFSEEQTIMRKIGDER